MTVRFILGVVVPYVSWAVFVLGLAWRTGSWLRRPVPVSVTLLPGPSSLGGRAAAMAGRTVGLPQPVARRSPAVAGRLADPPGAGRRSGRARRGNRHLGRPVLLAGRLGGDQCAVVQIAGPGQRERAAGAAGDSRPAARDDSRVAPALGPIRLFCPGTLAGRGRHGNGTAPGGPRSRPGRRARLSGRADCPAAGGTARRRPCSSPISRCSMSCCCTSRFPS